MKTIQEYLSGNFDEELNVIVAEARGWKRWEQNDTGGWTNDDGDELDAPPPFSTSLDACRELLTDLTEEEGLRFGSALADILQSLPSDISNLSALTRATTQPSASSIIWHLLKVITARQICVAYLIVRGILK